MQENFLILYLLRLNRNVIYENLSFPLKIDEEIETIIADEVRLKQIFVNLISNAIKFSYDNTSQFNYCITRKNNFIFKIKVTGIGISRSDIQKLFSPFLSNAIINTKNMGSGLGLSITKKLVEASSRRNFCFK